MMNDAVATGASGADSVLLAEMKSYIGLTDVDESALVDLLPIVKPHFKQMADEFYAVIRMHPGAFAVFKDEAQARRLHASLQAWIAELLEGPHDAAYFAHHSRIGQMHVRVGLKQHYMVTAMSRIRGALQSIAGRAHADDPQRGVACWQAIARVCDLDLAIMLDSYRRDTNARLERVQQLERDAVEARHLERKRFLNEAIEAANVLVLGFDEVGRLFFFNRCAEALTGYMADEVLDRDPFDHMFGEQGPSLRAQLLAASRGSPVEIEADLRNRAGRLVRVSWHAASHEAPGGNGPRVVLVGIDVTERRDLERRARQSERLAAAGVLAAGLAHEIRNPLNGAGLHLSILERAIAKQPGGGDPSILGAVEVVKKEVRRLSTLVTDFLDVARPPPLARALTDLNSLAGGAVLLLTPEAAARRVKVVLDSWPFAADANVDPERTKQVLLNLLRNAIEAVQEGGLITVRVRRMTDCLEFEVEDDGPGLVDPAAPIFDAFFTTKERGTGLGLFIVNRIVTDHGGHVRVSSVPGCTTFTVRLPLDSTEARSP